MALFDSELPIDEALPRLTAALQQNNAAVLVAPPGAGKTTRVPLWLLDTPAVNGLFNLGTGRARTYLDLAHAVCDAAGQPRNVEFIDMPASLQGQYQSFTEAPMERLRAAGYAGQFTPLEEGIRQYVQNHLAKTDRFV